MQVYLGGFQTPEQAALAFDIAALRLRGADAQTNFDPRHYAGALAELAATPAADVFEALRRQGRGQGMQSSCYRGVSRHAKVTGLRWEAGSLAVAAGWLAPRATAR